MSEKLLAAGVAVILGAGAAAGAILILEALDRPAPATAPPDPTVLLYGVGVPVGGASSPAPRSPAPPTLGLPDEETVLIQSAISVADSVGRPLIAGTLHVAGDAIKTGTLDLSAPYAPPAYDDPGVFDATLEVLRSPSSESVGNAFEAASGDVLGVSKLAVEAGVKLVGLRGATEEQQEAILANTALATVQGALNAIPVFGSVLSLGLGALASTFEGQKILADVGTALQDAYTFQRELLAGDVKGALGLESGRRERLRRLLAAIRETQPISDPRLLAAQDAAARGEYAGALKGTDLDRFDATLRAESTLNAATLAEQAAKFGTYEKSNAESIEARAATETANAAFRAQASDEELRASYMREELATLGIKRGASRGLIERDFANQLGQLAKKLDPRIRGASAYADPVTIFGASYVSQVRKQQAAVAAERDATLAAFDAETARLAAAIRASYYPPAPAQTTAPAQSFVEVL